MMWGPRDTLRRCGLSRGQSGRLAPWLVAAGALHLAIVVALWGSAARWPPTPNRNRAARVPRALEPIGFELADEGEPTPLAVDAAHAEGRAAAAANDDPKVDSARAIGAAVGAAAPSEHRRELDGASGGSDGAPRGLGRAESLDSAESDAEPAARRLSLRDLGIGAGANPFIGSPGELPSERQLLNQRLRNELRGELARRDQRRGLGPEGPAVAAIVDIVLASATAPNTSALLRVLTDEAGKVTLVDVLDADRDDAEWRRIADRLLRALAGKRLRVPPRSGGVSFQLRVVSRVQLPSGADPGLAIDLFGIPVKEGDGDRSSKLSLVSPTLREVAIPGSDGATMRVPQLSILGLAGDASDIGRVARRLVSAYLVAMDTEVPLEAPAIEPGGTRSPSSP